MDGRRGGRLVAVPGSMPYATAAGHGLASQVIRRDLLPGAAPTTREPLPAGSFTLWAPLPGKLPLTLPASYL